MYLFIYLFIYLFVCLFIYVYLFFTEFPDGGFNGAENGSLPNHAAKNGNPSVNDTEGRWPDKIYLAHYFSGWVKGLIRNMTGSVYHWWFIIEIQKYLSDRILV